MQDRGEPPGDDADAYPQVLAGLKLAARHAAEPLLDSLLTWRREALAQAAKAKPEVMILRKRVRPGVSTLRLTRLFGSHAAVKV